MKPLWFRDAIASDLPVIVDIYNSTIAGRMVTADTHPVSPESKKKWFDEHDPLKRPLWIVEDQGKSTVGWVSFQSFVGRPAYDATAEISIYLHENFRGQQLGKQILQYAIDHCGDYGIKTILGVIFAHNEPSLKLFYAFGFQAWGKLPDVATLDGIQRSVLILGKRIIP
jgi:L-amino acid N-acyltransferase YncA